MAGDLLPDFRTTSYLTPCLRISGADDEEEEVQRRADEDAARGGGDIGRGRCEEARHGVSRETIYTWRRRFTGVDVKEAGRLRELEKENTRLKKILAERDLEIEVMKEIAARYGERGGTQTAGGVRARSRPVEPSR